MGPYREKEPVVGYALKHDPTRLVTSIAMSSWFWLILYPFTRLNDFEIAMRLSRRMIVATGSSPASAEMKSFKVNDRLANVLEAAGHVL